MLPKRLELSSVTHEVVVPSSSATKAATISKKSVLSASTPDKVISMSKTLSEQSMLVAVVLVVTVAVL
eukprot:6045040-Amphidinium_carterae.1